MIRAILLSLMAIVYTASAYGETKLNFSQFKTSIQWTDWSMNIDEKVYMAIHLIDVLQTMQHGPDNCYIEIDPITRTMIGRNPSREQVLMWGVAQAAVGHYTFQMVNRSNLPKWSKRTLKWTMSSMRFNVVHNNYQIGLTLWGRPDYYRGGPAMVQCAQRNGYR